MREEDITDCIQTLEISDSNILLRLCSRLSSNEIAQVIKTLRLTERFAVELHRVYRFHLVACFEARRLRGWHDRRSLKPGERVYSDSFCTI